MRIAMWQRVKQCHRPGGISFCPYLEAKNASWKGCYAPEDEHLPASRCSSADSRVSVLYKRDYPFLRIAAVSHNVTRRYKAMLPSAIRSFRSARERTDPFAGGIWEKLTKVCIAHTSWLYGLVGTTTGSFPGQFVTFGAASSGKYLFRSKDLFYYSCIMQLR